MKKIAVIDIGSNSIHMDIFQLSGKQIQLKDGKGFFNKLGRYLSEDRIIPEKKIQESVRIIQHLLRYAGRKGANEIFIFGTSILRKAKNQVRFCKEVFRKTALKIDIVSSSRESGLVEEIARTRMRINKKAVLLVDIGGGSTELVLLNKRKTFYRRSYAYGLSKTKGKFGITHFRSKEKDKALRIFFKTRIKQFFKNVSSRKTERMIGFSSVVKTFACIKYGAIKRREDFLGKKITLQDLLLIRNRLKKNFREVPIQPERRDLVYIATFFFESLFQATGVNQLEVSPYSIREGYLLKHLKNKKAA